MSVTFKNFEFTGTNFDDFYNILYDIEDHQTSWMDEDYAEETAERNYRRYYEKQKVCECNSKEYLKNREVDLRRMLLNRIGKYEPEEGEIFE